MAVRDPAPAASHPDVQSRSDAGRREIRRRLGHQSCTAARGRHWDTWLQQMRCWGATSQTSTPGTLQSAAKLVGHAAAPPPLAPGDDLDHPDAHAPQRTLSPTLGPPASTAFRSQGGRRRLDDYLLPLPPISDIPVPFRGVISESLSTAEQRTYLVQPLLVGRPAREYGFVAEAAHRNRRARVPFSASGSRPYVEALSATKAACSAC